MNGWVALAHLLESGAPGTRLDLVELVMALEEEFGVEVPEEELEGVETVGQAYDLIAGKLG